MCKREKRNETAQHCLLGLHHHTQSVPSLPPCTQQLDHRKTQQAHTCNVCEIATDNMLAGDVTAPSAARESVDSFSASPKQVSLSVSVDTVPATPSQVPIGFAPISALQSQLIKTLFHRTPRRGEASDGLSCVAEQMK